MPAAPVEIMDRPFTRADLAAMPDDGRRYEIIDGVLIVSAAPGRMHQRAVGRLYRILDDACPPELEVLIGSGGAVPRRSGWWIRPRCVATRCSRRPGPSPYGCTRPRSYADAR
jgi:Uma2 family endonuclease